MTNAPPVTTPVRLWLPSPQVWLKSELLDLHNELHFDVGPADYDSASWALRKFQFRKGDGPIDDRFDWNVRNAWLFPWQFSRRQLEPCYRRSMANFIIRHVGHWDGAAERYRALLSALSRPLRAVSGGRLRQVFALTPFSIIAQHFSDDAGSGTGSEIVHTEILFFYTFDSFVQEALARNAHAVGAGPDAIARAYEHTYTNTCPAAVLLRDPGELRLAALTASDFSWTGIRSHMPPRSLQRMGGVAEDRPLELRETLFYCRLQAHLMTAIAAACRGIASFQNSLDASPLVAPMPTIPTIDELAPFWLRHLFGAYDHVDACMRLLDSLARHNEKDVRLDPQGRIVPGGTSMRTEAEESVGMAISPFGHDDTMAAHDTFRLGIFDTAIDDDALATWDRVVGSEFVRRRGG